MVDVVLQTPDLDVFGGPSSLNVSTDFGKTGERGTRVWVNNGDPATTLINQDVNLYDLYINTNTGPNVYSWLYQYVPSIGSPVWEQVLKLNQQQYSSISAVTFDSSGEAILNIPTANITKDVGANLTADKFVIRYGFQNGAFNQDTPASSTGSPVASSFTYGITTIESVRNLTIVFKAASFDGTEWNPLTGGQVVHMFISYFGVPL
jgi:hypothetical protein